MIRVRQIKINVRDNSNDLLVGAIGKKLGVSCDDILNFVINRRSIDARKRDNVYFIYDVLVNLRDERVVQYSNDVCKYAFEYYSFNANGSLKLNNRPIIIGSGPCGLFCAYELAKYGYRPLIFERGEDIDNRVITVNDFWNNNRFNSNSNVQFGEGGAGTFSDGKLSTQIKDKNHRIDEVLNTFVLNGAPDDILYDFMPHIGTDRLRDVVKNMRNKIISMGGEFRYNSCLTDINVKDNHISSIVINDSEVIDCDVLVLAIGHSARDTFRMLNKYGVMMSNKPFAVGFRVMHSQHMIDYNQYGNYYKFLSPASYKLTYNTKSGRGVYSFCMCPGGYVVNASSCSGMTVVNGMSNRERESGVANSAIVVTVSEKDYGYELFDGVKFQEELEKKAYLIGNGLIPIQRYGDYLNGVLSNDISSSMALKGKYASSLLNNVFNDDINDAFKEGMKYFGSKINGFDDVDTLLAGVESRTSSPIRFFRDDSLESNILGVYPAGEGAGYAGGIVSSAVDGIKVFEQIVSKYSS